MATKKNTKSRWAKKPINKEQDTTGEIVTKQNQSMSVREILFRNTQGMTYDNYKTPYYEDQATFSSTSLNKVQEMEPVEKLQFLSDVENQVKTLKTKITDFEQAKAEAIKKAQESATIQNQTEPEV